MTSYPAGFGFSFPYCAFIISQFFYFVKRFFEIFYFFLSKPFGDKRHMASISFPLDNTYYSISEDKKIVGILHKFWEGQVFYFVQIFS